MQFLEDLYAIVVFAWIVPFIPLNKLLDQKYAKLLLFLFIYSVAARILVLTMGSGIPPIIAFTGLCARLSFVPVAYLFIRRQIKKTSPIDRSLVHVFPLALFIVFCGICYLGNQNVSFLSETYLNHFRQTSTKLDAAVFSIWLGGYWISGIYLWLVVEMLLEQFRLRESKPVSHLISDRSESGSANKIFATNPFFTSDKQVKEYDARIQLVLNEKRLYLQPRFSLQQFADELKIPMHHLSAFINSYYKVNFNDLINERRVQHSISLIAKGESEFKTLEAISFESGFKNRNTFTAAFKKVTGMSPSAYVKKIKPGTTSAGPVTFSSNWQEPVLKSDVIAAM